MTARSSDCLKRTDAAAAANRGGRILLEAYRHLGSLARSVQRYAHYLRRLVADAAAQFHVATIAVVAAAALGVSAQAAAIAFFFLLVKTAMGDGLLRKAGFVFDVHTPSVFVTSATAATVLALVGAGMVFLARRHATRMARAYTLRCAARLVSRVGDSSSFPVRTDEAQIDCGQIRKMAITDARMCGLTFRTMLDAVVPATTMIVALAGLLWLNAVLSLVVFALLAVYLVPYSWIGRSLTRHVRQRESATRDAHADGMAIIGHIGASSAAVPAAGDLSQLWRSETTDQHLEVLEAPFVARYRTELLNSVLAGLSFLLILTIFGLRGVQSRDTWAECLAYIMVLRFAVQGIRALTGALMRTNRFLPYAVRYFSFLDSLPQEAESAPTAARGNLVIEPEVPQWHSAACWHCELGTVLAYVHPRPLSRYTIASMLQTLIDHQGNAPALLRSSVHFVSLRDGHLPASLLYNVVGRAPRSDDHARVESALRSLGIWDRVERLPRGLDTVMHRAAWRELDNDLRIALRFVPIVLGERPIVVCDGRLLRDVSAPVRDKLCAALAARTLVVTYPRPVALGEAIHVQAVAVALDGELLAVGGTQWYGAHREEIAQHWRTFVDDGIRVDDDLMDEEDDDYEDEAA